MNRTPPRPTPDEQERSAQQKTKGATEADTPATDAQNNLPQTRLIPVSRWNDYHAWPPSGGLRHLVFYANTNGFASAFKRVGRRVLVDEAQFFRVVAAMNASDKKSVP